MNNKYNNKRKRILGIIIIMLIAILLLFFVRLTFVAETSSGQKTPANRTYSYTVPEVITQQTCINRTYNWTYKWDGWADDVKDFISPNYVLYNNEGRSGEYSVRFLFFDYRVKAFVSYEGKDYGAVKDELGNASMASDNVTFTLDPRTSKIVNIYTRKADPQAKYWVYADVKAPQVSECVTKKTTVTRKVTNTSVVYDSVPNKSYENITVRLIDYIIYVFTAKQ